MTALAPVDAASCRAMAVECGRRANGLYSIMAYSAASAQIERARELTILALKFEAEEQNSPAVPCAGGANVREELVARPDTHPHSPSQAAVVTDENLRKPMAAASGQIIREDGDAPQDASDGGNLSDTEFTHRNNAGAA